MGKPLAVSAGRNKENRRRKKGLHSKNLDFVLSAEEIEYTVLKRFARNVQQKKYADNLKRKDTAKDRQYQHDRKERLKAAGICIKCAKRKAETGKTKCATCNIKERERARRYRGGIPRSERPAYGMCYFCGAEIKTGKIGETCKKRITKNLPKEPVPNEHWRKAEYSRITEIINRKEKKASGSDYNV